MHHDKSLCHIVHREIIQRKKQEWQLSATLTRFGGLCVIVINLSDPDDSTCYQGDNILEARNWLDSHTDYSEA